jgi:hypothetical protein
MRDATLDDAAVLDARRNDAALRDDAAGPDARRNDGAVRKGAMRSSWFLTRTGTRGRRSTVGPGLLARSSTFGFGLRTHCRRAARRFASSSCTTWSGGWTRRDGADLRATVGPDPTKVEYVRSYRSIDENSQRHNGAISDTYPLMPR